MQPRIPSLILERAFETLQAPEHEQQKRQVITAIKDLGLKVTAGDVAQKAALPVLRVTELLNNVAYETQGHLVVDTAGSVTYKFDPNFESRYLINPSKDALRWCGRVLWNACKLAFKFFVLASFLLIRLSFGVLLIASVVLVVVLIVAAIVMAFMAALKDSDSGGGDLNLGDSGELFNFDWLTGVRYWTFDWCWDWWYWGHYLRHDPYYYNSSYSSYSNQVAAATTDRTSTEPAKTGDDRKFLDSCFNVLFGCADVNANWEIERWQVVAQAIRAKAGVIVAEDIAPYMEVTDKNEDWMLPVLVRFNGTPEVTDSGKIIYIFPALVPASYNTEPANANEASSDDLRNIYQQFITRQRVQQHSQPATTLPPFLSKHEQPLTGIGADQVIAVLFFAQLASGGSIGLLIYAIQLPFIEILRPVLLTIAAYGALFFLLPALRWPFVANKNTRIKDENELRELAAQRLARPDADLTRWQAECANIRTEVLSGEAKRIAFTTEEDALAQQFADGSIKMM